MEIAVLFFLSSGLFLGWALGANDAANVFGTAVGTRMVKFGTAALICSIFVILGATISGAGAAHTLGKLGAVNALGGSFMAAFSAAAAVYAMTKVGIPVSTSQAIVGSIIGWNLYSENVTDTNALIKIVTTWFVCPVLAAVLGASLYKLTHVVLGFAKLHLLRLDAYTRIGLVLAGAFGSYSLGANNIANVMGVFVPSSPFTEFRFMDLVTLSSVQQLFLLGAIAIAVGVFTYSKRVMLTVGGGLMPLSAVGAWVVVVSHSIVLFLFASVGLESILASNGLPTIPLVPVSSSQAVIGAVIGIGLLKGGRGIRWNVLGGIFTGWMITPIISALICFVGLYFLQNVFDQKVYQPVSFEMSEMVIERLDQEKISRAHFVDLTGQRYDSGRALMQAVGRQTSLSSKEEGKVLDFARISPLTISIDKIEHLDTEWFSGPQIQALKELSGRSYRYNWRLADALSKQSEAWKLKPKITANKLYNKGVSQRLEGLYRKFKD